MSANMMQTGRYVLKRCERCGEPFAVTRNYASRTNLCPECRRIAARKKARKKERELRSGAINRAAIRDTARAKASDGSRIETRGRCGGSHAGGVDTSPWRRREFC